MPHYFLFAGEISGDLHGSRLMQALQEQGPCSFSGIAGPLMRTQGLSPLFPMEDFQVMGFSDVLKAFPGIYKRFYTIRDAILKTRPTCVILIDYPGFNLRLARSLRQKGYTGKIVQYICPSVWAHGKKRIQTMVQTLDLLLTIYPFEAAYFANTSLNVRYIGNPLVETIGQHVYQDDWMSQLHLPKTEELIALFPGSRLAEINRHAPTQLQVAHLLKKQHPSMCFALSYAHESLRLRLEELIAQSHLTLGQDVFLVPYPFSYELMRDCRLALAKSGTVNLELALHQKPSVVLYQLSLLNYIIAKYVLRLKLPYYCLVNLLSQKEVFPEFIGQSLDVEAMSRALLELNQSGPRRDRVIDACSKIQQQLGIHQTPQIGAKAIKDLISC